jgi:hypothetical protein
MERVSDTVRFYRVFNDKHRFTLIKKPETIETVRQDKEEGGRKEGGEKG